MTRTRLPLAPLLVEPTTRPHMRAYFIGQRLPRQRLTGRTIERRTRLLGDHQGRAVALGFGPHAKRFALLFADDGPPNDPRQLVTLRHAPLDTEDVHIVDR